MLTDEPILTRRAAGGMLCVTPFADNVVHVALYPEKPVPLPFWGIDARPAGKAADVCAAQEADGTLCIGYPDDPRRVRVTRLALEPAVVSGEQTFHLHAVFAAAPDERFFGLGQHQDGVLDLAGREWALWHDYGAPGGEVVGVPVLVSDRGYAVVFDNTSRLTVSPGVNGETTWYAEVGDAISFFVILGRQTDALYEGYRLLCGETPMPPLAGLGFIQCKQRYKSREELMRVARTYREKGYPCDMLVVDWFHWNTLGDMDLNEAEWPDAAGMNAELAAMGYEVMISCWPRFMKESKHYDTLEERGWFMRDTEGATVYGTEKDRRGALIDTTDPACGAWYARAVYEGYGTKGFRHWWLDEDEPDICPHPFYLHAGTGARVHNLYPLTHTRCLYEHHRREREDRVLLLSRAAYLGAQRYGTTFWSSDIHPTWDVLRRQIPTALNVCASGLPYWSSDIGGWRDLPENQRDQDYAALLVETRDAPSAAALAEGKLNYAELYVRWFQFGAFCPTFRTHGTRPENEVWSFGPQAERILARYLRLRYRLMPYIYSLAWRTRQTGAPFMRAMWMDFPDAAAVGDQFMFGDALLVAPVTEQGAVSRPVYLPAERRWYDFWTGAVYEGGQTIHADAPLDMLPLFVPAGAVLPMQEETGMQVRVYPGADGAFTLYEDDRRTYAYENGAYRETRLEWNDGAGTLSGAPDGCPVVTAKRDE